MNPVDRIREYVVTNIADFDEAGDIILALCDVVEIFEDKRGGHASYCSFHGPRDRCTCSWKSIEHFINKLDSKVNEILGGK